jgi:hypothetical protein
MTKYLVKDAVQDQDTKQLITVVFDLDEYCKLISSKIFSAMFRYEELTGNKLKDDYILRSNLLDAVGLANRLPRNISQNGDYDEEL